MRLDRQTPFSAHWSRSQYEAMFDSAANDNPSRRVIWVGEAEPLAPDNGVRSADRKILGFLVGHQVGTEWELEDIVVVEKVRRAGLGVELLQELIDHARAARGSAIRLEVRESNEAAKSLYQKLHFKKIGLRKGYYSNPSEDAIVYELRLD